MTATEWREVWDGPLSLIFLVAVALAAGFLAGFDLPACFLWLFFFGESSWKSSESWSDADESPADEPS